MSAPAPGTKAKVARGALYALDALWLVGAAWAVSLVDVFDYGDQYDPGWRIAVAVLVAAAPVVLLARRPQRILLAWGVFLAGALLFLGVCLAGA